MMITLASFGSPMQPLPPPVPLPGPPLLDTLLFERPLLLAGPLLVLAVVALFTFNARADLRKGLLWAGVLLAVAGAVVVAATLVTTPREQVRSATRRLIAAVATADPAAMAPLMADDIEIRYPGFGAPDKPALITLVQRQMGPGGPFRVSSHRISELQASLDGASLARSQVLVRATHEATAVPASAWVLLKWERDGDGAWRCFAVEPIDIR